MQTFKQFIAESTADAGIFKAVFVIGLPGAGKSFTVRNLAGKISPVVVNTDRAVEFLASKLNISASSSTWNNFEDSALRITKTSLKNYVNGVLPLFVDGTSNSASNTLRRIGILESLGYDVGIVYVKTSLDTAIARIQSRNSKSNRQVDLSFVEKVHRLSDDNAKYLKTKVDFYREFVNDGTVLDNNELQDIFKKVQSFFASPIANPVGKRNLQKLLREKQKYLTPTIISEEALSNVIDGWYKT
jgi:shikimate kinase